VWRKSEEPKAQSLPDISTSSHISTGVISTTPKAEPPAPLLSPRATACISQGIRITGEITGNEDIFVDGEVKGRIRIADAKVTIGPNGRVEGPIVAREIAVRGDVVGDLDGTERVHVWHTGQTLGEIRTKRIVLEDGADVRVGVETVRERQEVRTDREALKVAASETSDAAAFSEIVSSV